MQEDSQQFMERYIRARAVAPLDPDSPGLHPRDRRSWWEFCLWMHEFIDGILQNRLVGQHQAQRLSRLQWILIRGSYVFGTSDPALRGEQRRYVELCVILSAAFALVVDDPEGSRDALDYAFGPKRFWSTGDLKWLAESEALMENWLRWWKNWEEASSPIGWIKARARSIHEQDHMQGGHVRESDAMYRTPQRKRDDSGAALALDYRETPRGVVSLEQVSESPRVAEVALQPRYTRISVAALEAEIQSDEDLRAYAHLRHQGWKRRAAWERLGWPAKYGEAVDRRYRRFLARVKASGFRHQTRNIEVDRGVFDASCTVVKERLRIPVHPTSEATLSGRVVYEPRSVDFSEAIEKKRKISSHSSVQNAALPNT
ncbi:MAG: hypothetical protein ABSF98_07830 [Bryobacteraceae bacterium]|jgi:hypothetical protein